MPSWLIRSRCGGMCKQHLLAAAELQSSKDFSVRDLWRSSRPTCSSKQGFMGSSHLLFWKTYCISGNASPVTSEHAWMPLVLPWNTTKQVYSLPFLCTHWDKTCHIGFLIIWHVPATVREQRNTIHHSAWFCPSPDGPQMSLNLSTFAARRLLQGTDVHVWGLTDCPKGALWLIQECRTYSGHKLTWKNTSSKRLAWIWTENICCSTW